MGLTCPTCDSCRCDRGHWLPPSFWTRITNKLQPYPIWGLSEAQCLAWVLSMHHPFTADGSTFSEIRGWLVAHPGRSNKPWARARRQPSTRGVASRSSLSERLRRPLRRQPPDGGARLLRPGNFWTTQVAAGLSGDRRRPKKMVLCRSREGFRVAIASNP